jgi:hypothetical protein
MKNATAQSVGRSITKFEICTFETAFHAALPAPGGSSTTVKLEIRLHFS